MILPYLCTRFIASINQQNEKLTQLKLKIIYQHGTKKGLSILITNVLILLLYMAVFLSKSAKHSFQILDFVRDGQRILVNRSLLLNK
jgi:hypothetical protein